MCDISRLRVKNKKEDNRKRAKSKIYNVVFQVLKSFSLVGIYHSIRRKIVCFFRIGRQPE